MAKNKKSGKQDQEEKGYSAFQWILFVGIIPLVFETMSPQNVAAILMKMTDEQAVSILSQLNTDQQAQVLEKLPPDTAAKYTRLLANP